MGVLRKQEISALAKESVGDDVLSYCIVSVLKMDDLPVLRARTQGSALLVSYICRCSVNGGFLREKIIDSRGGVG